MLDRKYGSPTITKDGLTLAKQIELKDAMEIWARKCGKYGPKNS
jgi:chaperonin GroEL (HSP60 family)